MVVAYFSLGIYKNQYLLLKINKLKLVIVLTDKDVAHKRGGQTEHDDQDISNSEVHNEEVGNSAHSRAAVHDGDHEAVTHQAHDED